MMVFDSHKLHRFRPMRSMVLTTPVFRTDVVKIGSLELYQDTSFREGYHQPIVQRVVRTPKNLVFGRERRYIQLDNGENYVETASIDAPLPHCMPWLVPMELKRDDTVYVDSFMLATAEKDNRIIECEGVKYYLIPYGDIYFRLVNGKPEMLNGWVMVEPVTEPQADVVKRLLKSGIVLPGITIDNNNRKEMGAGDKLAVVRYIGPPVEKYLETDTEVHDEISVGEVVVLKLQHNRRLEIGGAKFFGDKELIITRRERIVGSIYEGLF